MSISFRHPETYLKTQSSSLKISRDQEKVYSHHLQFHLYIEEKRITILKDKKRKIIIIIHFIHSLFSGSKIKQRCKQCHIKLNSQDKL